MDISTGIVAPSSANADSASEIGNASAESLTGKNYASAKMKRNDRVVSISMASNSVHVRVQEVELNSTLLFLRVTCVIKSSQEMEEYLKYEFGKQAPALFDKGMMRKGSKSTLANILKEPVQPSNTADPTSKYVVDGGHLLQVPWPK